MRLLLLPIVVLALLALGCGAEQPRERDGDQAKTDSTAVGQRELGPRYGISVSLPTGWEGRLRRGSLAAATVSLSPEGAICLREMACSWLGEDDVRVLLFETAPENRSPPTNLGEFPALPGALRLEVADFQASDGNSDDSLRTGHGFARTTFRLSGRLFVLFAETGSLPPTSRALAGLNELLATLAVDPGDVYPGTVEPARLPERPGWDVGRSGADEVDADGEFTTTWAATIPYADEWNALPPYATLERLPRDGIVIWLGLSRTNRFPPPKEARSAPFQLENFELVEHWEGQVRNLPEYRLWGTIHEDTHLDLRVYFGRTDPTLAMLSEAQAMLDGLDVPQWGPWELEP